MTEEERRARNAEYQRRWRIKHPETYKAIQRRSEEKRRGKRVGYYARLPEEIKIKKREYCKKWRQDNIEKDHALKKRNHLKKIYGITPEQYDAMLSAQNNVCAICLEPEKRAGKQLCVDHCHNTGIVRGLLCSRCNVCLGQLEENQVLLTALINYITKHKGA